MRVRISAIPHLFDRSKSALEQVDIQLLKLGPGEGEREVDALVQGLDLRVCIHVYMAWCIS